jgi:ferredoxin
MNVPNGAAIRVEVDGERCQGHNRCYALAPEVFDVDDYGNAVVRGDGSVSADLDDTDLPNADLVNRVRLAAANCPEYAITVVDD